MTVTITYLGTLATDLDKVRFNLNDTVENGKLDMSPRFAVHYHGDVAARGIESRGDLAVRQVSAGVKRPYLKNRSVGLLCHWMLFSNIVLEHINGVALVFCVRNPFQVIGAIVVCVPVLVIHLTALWDKAVKCFGNKPMKGICARPAIPTQDHRGISPLPCMGLQNPERYRPAATGNPLYAPMIAYLINAFIADDGVPVLGKFGHSSPPMNYCTA